MATTNSLDQIVKTFNDCLKDLAAFKAQSQKAKQSKEAHIKDLQAQIKTVSADIDRAVRIEKKMGKLLA